MSSSCSCSSVSIVLVCIGNFQDYILQNISQLIRLGHSQIYILTNTCFFERFDIFLGKIKLISVDELSDSYQFFDKTSLNKTFRGGFWTFTSLRFFYIYEFMAKYDVRDVIHLENDVLIYYNCNIILDCFEKNVIYIPFDTFSRNIASIMFIPSAEVFKMVLDRYDFSKNDMENFYGIQKQTGLIQNLPIFPRLDIGSRENTSFSSEYDFVTSNYSLFNGFIFDAAAIGQFIGGVDPRNIPGDTTGFINETCIIKYNTYSVIWKTMNDSGGGYSVDNDIKCPFLVVNNTHIPIFNLHIHSKNLTRFI